MKVLDGLGATSVGTEDDTRSRVAGVGSKVVIRLGGVGCKIVIRPKDVLSWTSSFLSSSSSLSTLKHSLTEAFDLLHLSLKLLICIPISIYVEICF
ncbi:hypothetical protein VNO77_34067 [Canavalia gladiata]|uniref:Uncharacterized protein n=1 Tax=Canavalia gladiata TaxID=3824 RepID=A0AAN9KG37_CANGL